MKFGLISKSVAESRGFPIGTDNLLFDRVGPSRSTLRWRRGISSVCRLHTNQTSFLPRCSSSFCITPAFTPVLTFVESPPMAHKVLSKPHSFSQANRILAICSACDSSFSCFLWGKVEQIVAARLTSNTIVLFLDLCRK